MFSWDYKPLKTGKVSNQSTGNDFVSELFKSF